MIEFITLSNNPARIGPLERSISAAMAGFSVANPDTKIWRLTVMDGAKYDLFSGYNAAVAQTASNGGGEHLVFLHHDVLLLSNSIAFERPLALLNEPTIGFVGPVGATRLNSAGAWWGDMPIEQVMASCRGMVGLPQKAMPGVVDPFGFNIRVWPGPVAMCGQSLVIDGVFMMCHRRTFERVGGFDQQTFKGFHFYDLDISLKAHFSGLKNYVAPILMFHDSVGNYDQLWEAARQLFVKKWAGRLPVQI